MVSRVKLAKARTLWSVDDARIILFDLEILPNLLEALKVWPQISNYPGTTLKASVTSIICAGWKVLNQDGVHCINAWDFPEWQEDINNDKKVCEAISAILQDAHCVVTHNGKKFDWKFLQTRLRYHKLPPLPPINHVDTCAEAKRELYVFNNRLQTIARFLTDMEKRENEGWDLWVKVWHRDPAAQSEMTKYCKQDVLVLESVFNEIRPIVRGLPNQNLFSPMKENVCPHCGSTRIRKEGKRYTQTGAYQRYICTDCHAYSRTNLADQLPR